MPRAIQNISRTRGLKPRGIAFLGQSILVCPPTMKTHTTRRKRQPSHPWIHQSPHFPIHIVPRTKNQLRTFDPLRIGAFIALLSSRYHRLGLQQLWEMNEP